MNHGTLDGYNNHGCRCDECREASRAYQRDRRARRGTGKLDGFELDPDRLAFSDLLHELFPLGLTDDCPARKALQPVGEGP